MKAKQKAYKVCAIMLFQWCTVFVQGLCNNAVSMVYCICSALSKAAIVARYLLVGQASHMHARDPLSFPLGHSGSGSQ